MIVETPPTVGRDSPVEPGARSFVNSDRQAL
jgi:hypothetical protein